MKNEEHDRKLRFSLATNFDDGLVEAVVGTPVDCLYGKLDPDPIGGGRAAFTLPALSRRRVEEHIARARARGLGFHYLLNAACTDNMEQSRWGQRLLDSMFDWLETLPITGITVASPYMLRRVKRSMPRIQVRVSVFAQVDRVAKARMWEDLGADSIVLDSLLVNRDFRTLAAIREAVSLELELLANNSCLLDCALSPFHMTTLAHASQCDHGSGGTFVDWCHLRCGQSRLLEPRQYLRGDWIRPEDLDRYQDLGYHRFKLVERGAPTAVLVRRVHAYAARRFEGNLLELVQPFGFREPPTVSRWTRFWTEVRRVLTFLKPWSLDPRRLMKLARLAKLRGMLHTQAESPVVLDNRSLDGLLEGWPEDGCRNRDCARCGYCDALARKALRIDPAHRDEVLALYREILDDTESGAMWWSGRGPGTAEPEEVSGDGVEPETSTRLPV